MGRLTAQQEGPTLTWRPRDPRGHFCSSTSHSGLARRVDAIRACVDSCCILLTVASNASPGSSAAATVRVMSLLASPSSCFAVQYN